MSSFCSLKNVPSDAIQALLMHTHTNQTHRVGETSSIHFIQLRLNSPKPNTQ